MDDTTSSLPQQAINAAIYGNWQQAVELNQKILDVDPNNVDAINRMARANFELGQINESKKLYQKAVQIDPYNQIAAKFLKRIEAFKVSGLKSPLNTQKLNPNISLSELFIEEPGKTKVVPLIKVAEPHKLSLLSSGDEVLLVAKKRGITVTDLSGNYLGVLPDDISHSLLRLINGGNKYQALVKTIKTTALAILIKEIYRSTRFKNQASFLDNLNGNLAYSSDHIIVPDDVDTDSEDYVEEEAN